jgi:tripartite-type tricarboxylate transporter receptor subunit TctC
MNRRSTWIGCVVVFSLVVSAIFAGCGGQQAGKAEKWPTRPITLIVGFAPGGGMDVMCRALAPEMAKKLGVEVVVQNMPGAGSGTAADFVIKQAADGYTLFAPSSAVATFPAMANSNVTYKEMGMLAIPIIAEPTFLVHKNSPVKNMNDLIALWKKGGSTGSNTGAGGLWHIPQVLSVNAVGGNVKYVPYPSGKDTAMAVAKGDVEWGTSGALMEAGGLIVEGLIRPLAIFSDKPYQLVGYGEIPPITQFIPELKDKIVAGAGWRGLAYKKGIPKDRLDKIAEATKFAIESESFQQMVKKNGLIAGNYYGAEADKAYEQTTRIQSWLLHDLKISRRSPETMGVLRP